MRVSTHTSSCQSDNESCKMHKESIHRYCTFRFRVIVTASWNVWVRALNGIPLMWSWSDFDVVLSGVATPQRWLRQIKWPFWGTVFLEISTSLTPPVTAEAETSITREGKLAVGIVGTFSVPNHPSTSWQIEVGSGRRVSRQFEICFKLESPERTSVINYKITRKSTKPCLPRSL